MNNESQTLANVLNKTRDITNLYLKLLEKTDWHKTYESEGTKLNTVFWLAAHISITQNFLALRCTGGEKITLPYARQFGLGSTPSTAEDSPSKEEMLSNLNLIHEKSINHVASLDPSFLDEVNPTGFEFLGENSVRSMIVHAIRHENLHAGHLGWLCKLNGIKTI